MNFPNGRLYRFKRILLDRGLRSLDPQAKRWHLGPVGDDLQRLGTPDLGWLAQRTCEKLTKASGESSYFTAHGGWETRRSACDPGLANDSQWEIPLASSRSVGAHDFKGVTYGKTSP